MVVHQPFSDRSTKCDQCGKTVLKLQKHMLRMHSDKKKEEKKFLCRFCSSAFHDSSRRKQHERIHTLETPYKCPDCPKSFRHSEYLRLHKPMHTGEKKFACKFCGKRFSRCTNKNIHEKHLHMGKFYDCPKLCGMQFRRKNKAMDHGEQCNGQESFIKFVK